MSDIVVDASAVLAVIKDEPGAPEAARHAERARISAVNYCEIVAWLADHGASPEDAQRLVEAFHLIVDGFDGVRAIAAGLLAAKTRRRDISFADRACLALAMELGLPVMTGDRAWRELDLGVEVRLFR